MPARRLSAKWVYPVAAPPIHSGAVLISDDGHILAVGPESEVPTPPGTRGEHFHDAVLMPGLVNAHTHLELTGLAGLVAERDFASWIRSVRSLKATRSMEDFRSAARDGVRRSLAAGITTVAETGDTGTVVEALTEVGGRGIVFQEVFGPHPDQCSDSMAQLSGKLESLASQADGSSRVSIGLSPHAPYTVSGLLYRAVGELAESAGLPLAVHLAESQAESDLLASGTGPFQEAWARRGIPLPDPLGDSPVGWLARHGVLRPGLLCIHCVRVTDADIDLLVRHQCTVAHCPVSNRAHGHGDAPLTAMLKAGVTVGLGTDSEVSAKPDLLADARLARELGGLSAGAALELATVGSARAIGLGESVGALQPGRWADLVVRRIDPGTDAYHLAEALLQSGDGAVLRTVVAGHDAWSR